MGWKNWSYWLKGGIIGGLCGIIISLIVISYYGNGLSCWTDMCFADISDWFEFMPTRFIIVLPIAIIGKSSINSIAPGFYGDIIEALLLIVYYAIIGSIIGLIYSKLKSKKGKNPKRK